MFQPVTNRIQVLVMQPEPILALGLVAALREHADFDVSSASALSIEEGVVIADYAGAMQLAQDSGRQGRLRIVLVALTDREHEVRRALEGGVHAYLVLGCSMQELVEAVRVVGRGSKYVSLQVAQRMADSLTRDPLTGREQEVLKLLSSGCCNKTIARKLDIAVGTVKAHVKGIMAKLDASSRTQAVSVATERGLVDEENAADHANVTAGVRGNRPAYCVSSLQAA